MEAGELVRDRPPEDDELGSERAAALVVGRLGRQGGEEVREAPARDGEEAPLARAAEQHLGHHQAEKLVIGDLARPPAPGLPLGLGRKEGAGSAIDCDQQGVEVGAHVGLHGRRAWTTPTFDALVFGPCYPEVTALAVNFRSRI